MKSSIDKTTTHYEEKVRTVYTSYVENGGEGSSVLKLRGENLGYDSNFLKRCSLKLETGIQEDPKRSSIENLFAAFCGSGCPLRIANDEYIPKKGDTVVDLGCGAGHDSLLAGGLVGSSGKVFCIDFTQAMLDQAKRNIEEYTDSVKDLFPSSFQFLRRSIDQPDELFSCTKIGSLQRSIADRVISNGVINLCTQKENAFRTAFELLKPGGIFLLSDLCVVDENPNVKISCTIGDATTS